MISLLPAISLVLPLFSHFSKRSSTASKKSNFKHYEDTNKWEPMKSASEHICMSLERCSFDKRIDSINKGEGKHTCMTPDRCPYNH